MINTDYYKSNFRMWYTKKFLNDLKGQNTKAPMSSEELVDTYFFYRDMYIGNKQNE